MSNTYYRKLSDGTFEAVSYYNSNASEAIPKDTAVLIINKGNSTLRKYDVDIAMAPLLAGCEYLRDQLALTMSLASKPRVPLAMTEAENKAWNNMIAVGGESFRQISYSSSHDMVDAGINALSCHMNHILSDPTCKDAYDKFRLCVKLKLETDNIV
jgi:hypothetical protein